MNENTQTDLVIVGVMGDDRALGVISAVCVWNAYRLGDTDTDSVLGKDIAERSADAVFEEFWDDIQDDFYNPDAQLRRVTQVYLVDYEYYPDGETIVRRMVPVCNESLHQAISWLKSTNLELMWRAHENHHDQEA